MTTALPTTDLLAALARSLGTPLTNTSTSAAGTQLRIPLKGRGFVAIVCAIDGEWDAGADVYLNDDFGVNHASVSVRCYRPSATLLATLVATLAAEVG